MGNRKGWGRGRKSNDAPRPQQVAQRQTFVEDKNVEKLYHGRSEADTAWQPTFGAVFKMLLSVRIASVLWGVINDCDEVYNYWEPLHMMLYKEGFQTWEYSPVYSIRSYFYLYLHFIPASVFRALFSDSKIAVFTMVRLTIGVFCVGGEYYAYKAICEKINVATGRFFIFFTIFSSGMFVASTAFLPSSFSMALGFYCLGAYLQQNWKFSIFCVAFSTLVGWPFVSILGMPIIFDMLVIRKNLRREFFTSSIACGVTIGIVMIFFDSIYFGKLVVAPFNIFYYNVIGGPGATLYGVESVTYYLKNFALNWNILIPFALLSGPVSLWHYAKTTEIPAGAKLLLGIPMDLNWIAKFNPILSYYYTMIFWMCIFFTSPHKEERFMFPIYPHIAFLSAVCVDALNRTFKKTEEENTENGEEEKKEGLENIYAVLFIFAILSTSRAYATYNNYGAHMEIYKALNDEVSSHHSFDRFHDPIRVCVGKEWHRYPSSFFIPEFVKDSRDLTRRVEMQFIQSEFRGILPKKWETAEDVYEMTRRIPTDMNDRNEEEVSRYVPLESCDYVVDLDMPPTDREPDMKKMKKEFKVVVEMPFIDAANSHFFFRAFYVPYFSDQKTTYTNYTLYRKVYDLP